MYWAESAKDLEGVLAILPDYPDTEMEILETWMDRSMVWHAKIELLRAHVYHSGSSFDGPLTTLTGDL